MNRNEQINDASRITIKHQRMVDEACDRFEKAFRSNESPRIEDFLDQLPVSLRNVALVELVKLDVELRIDTDIVVTVADYLARFPDDHDAIDLALFQTGPDDAKKRLALERSEQPHYDVPEHIDRYEIRKELGKGAFGRVYLAFDPQTNRMVAVKVPSKKLLDSGSSYDSFLNEAQHAGQLDHKHIVTLYDVQTEGPLPFIVQKYIDGCNLSQWIKTQRAGFNDIVRILIQVSDAMALAHQNRIYHRDLKPANILVDQEGTAYVTDFGLAIHAKLQSHLKGKTGGTYPYMSPEQTRRESHLIDGRSDVWSIGVMMYELLAGVRPFRAEKEADLFRAIQHDDPKPMRELRPAIPSVLARICERCLEKRKSDRYIAVDLKYELTEWLEKSDSVQSINDSIATSSEISKADTDISIDTDRELLPPSIIPKGLRSFDAHDAGFFLQLLPGPRDSQGLPDSIRFWKKRIEELNPEHTFRVGVVHGPSGSGKSSQIKAGLLPRLEGNVLAVYIEATPSETEIRLMKTLAKHVPQCPPALSLPELLSLVRERPLQGRKVLIVIDQFEQWLHTHANESTNELTDALRHCDGELLQCILVVRDDFWTPIKQFMRELETPLNEKNSLLVDRFSSRHAEKILLKFGQAYEALPDTLNSQQKRFVSQAIEGLKEENKIVSVRLSLFAQMMRDKPWTPDSLKVVGGTEGVGVTFFEETFSSSTAKKEHQIHEKAARAVLEALLPDSEAGIKGTMRANDELIELSGYKDQPLDFDDLLQTLDSELRLITPTSPVATTVDDDTYAENESSQDYYQLTHDYLIPSLREWLTRKRKETRRGRAELRLADRESLWNRKPERRNLPYFLEYVNIRALTNPKTWTEPQAQMMRKASRLHLARLTAIVAVLFVAGWAMFEFNGDIQAHAQIEVLKQAQPEALPMIVKDLRKYARWANPKLNVLLQTLEQHPTLTPDEKRYQLHARIALCEYDPSLFPVLKNELLTQPPVYLNSLYQALAHRRARLIKELREEFQNSSNSKARRFRAGIVMASYVNEIEWSVEDLQFIAQELISFKPELRFRPLAEKLFPHLISLFESPNLSEFQQVAAARALTEYGRLDGRLLASLLAISTPNQFEMLFPLLSESAKGEAIQYLREIGGQKFTDDFEPNRRLDLGRRRAGAAITMLRVGHNDVTFDVLRDTGDPESITQFIHRCRERGVNPRELLTCVDLAEKSRQQKRRNARKVENRVLYALILALGEFQLNELPKSDRDATVDKLVKWFRDDPSSGIHAATRSVLFERWNKKGRVIEIEQRSVPYHINREWFTLEIDLEVDKKPEKRYMTFVVFPPGEYEIGSESPKSDRQDLPRHRVSIDYPFAILDREIAFAELIAFDSKYRGSVHHLNATYEHSAMSIEWSECRRFCNWLTKQVGWSEADQCYSQNSRRDYSFDLKKRGFRLPTEAEWEIACRGGQMHGSFCFGNDASHLVKYGWYDRRDGNRPSRMLRPNLRGLFDVHGNVFEWTHEWNDKSTSQTWPKFASGGVARGGSWARPARLCRNVSRRPNANRSEHYIGFRLALSLDTP